MLANTQSTWPPTTSIGGQPPPDCQGGSRGLVRWRGVTLAPILPRPELPVQRVPVGERKLVTLLGCTLAQTGALRARVGLDALHSQMRTLYTLTQQEVHAMEGLSTMLQPRASWPSLAHQWPKRIMLGGPRVGAAPAVGGVPWDRPFMKDPDAAWV